MPLGGQATSELLPEFRLVRPGHFLGKGFQGKASAVAHDDDALHEAGAGLLVLVAAAQLKHTCHGFANALFHFPVEVSADGVLTCLEKKEENMIPQNDTYAPPHAPPIHITRQRVVGTLSTHH